MYTWVHVSEPLRIQGLLVPFKAKEAGTNPHAHTTSPLSRALSKPCDWGPALPTSCSQRTRGCLGKDNVITTLPLLGGGFGWLGRELEFSAWSGWVICSKSPSFTDRDRKGDKLTLRATSTLQDPCLETNGDDPKYFWKNKFSGKTQIGNFYIWKLEDNMLMLFLG